MKKLAILAAFSGLLAVSALAVGPDGSQAGTVTVNVTIDAYLNLVITAPVGGWNITLANGAASGQTTDGSFAVSANELWGITYPAASLDGKGGTVSLVPDGATPLPVTGATGLAAGDNTYGAYAQVTGVTDSQGQGGTSPSATITVTLTAG